jgi:zinc protease
MFKKFCCLAIILFFIIPINISARQLYHYKLKNGLQLFVKIDRRAPVVVSQIWYKVGSSYETLGITGISHVLEHMMFQGTQKYPPGKLMQIVAAHGGSQNAATSYDYTYYYQELPAKNLSLSFKLEADRMSNLLLSKKRFAKEIKVVREERRLRTDNNPPALTFERFFAAANIAIAYHHPIIGWMNDLQYLTIKDLKKWYKKYYVPNNAILVVVGNVQPNKVYLLAKKYFGKIKAKPLPITKPQYNVPSLGKRTVTVNVPAKVAIILMGYNVPVIKTAEHLWQSYALAVISGILDAGNSSRLRKELIRGQQIAAVAKAEYYPFSRLPSIFILGGMPTQKHSIQELQQAFLAQIKKLQTTLVTPKELQRIKNQLIAQRVFMQDALAAQATEIGSLESVGLSWRLGKNFIAEIEKITPQQIQQAAKEFLITKRLTVAILQPQTN